MLIPLCLLVVLLGVGFLIYATRPKAYIQSTQEVRGLERELGITVEDRFVTTYNDNARWIAETDRILNPPDQVQIEFDAITKAAISLCSVPSHIIGPYNMVSESSETVWIQTMDSPYPVEMIVQNVNLCPNGPKGPDGIKGPDGRPLDIPYPPSPRDPYLLI